MPKHTTKSPIAAAAAKGLSTGSSVNHTTTQDKHDVTVPSGHNSVGAVSMPPAGARVKRTGHGDSGKKS